MTNTPNPTKRWNLPVPRGPVKVLTDALANPVIWARFGLCAITAVILWIVMFGWSPAFPYRTRQAPTRQLRARVEFKYIDLSETEEAKRRARNSVLCFYENDPMPLEDLRQALIDRVFKIKSNEYADIDAAVWQEFLADPETESDSDEATEEVTEEELFARFQKALEGDERLERLKQAVEKAFIEVDKNGLLENLGHDLGQGSMLEIQVFGKGNLDNARRIEVPKVRIAQAANELKLRLLAEITNEQPTIEDSEFVADRVYHWLRSRLPTTLKWDQETTGKKKSKAAADVQAVMKRYRPGDLLPKLNQRGTDDPAIDAGEPLDINDIDLLRAEHRAFTQSMSFSQMFMQSVSFFGMYAAMFCLLAGYLLYRDRKLIRDLRHFSTLLGLILVTLTTAWLVSINVEWRAEMIPIVMFTMIVAIAYHSELAMLLGGIVALSFSISHGYDLGEFVILMGAVATSGLLCRTIRSRTRLVYVGLTAAAVAIPTTVGVQYMLGQPFGWSLLLDSIWFGGSCVMAGLFMTALLPFLEQWFDIQTDISLLELSDANHSLLKELVQRAPGTYNHSINVASISEAAADAIGANGLLCRVGSYFHDIGKMRKPEYFIENQGGGDNKHDDLNPNMSTIVIIAHVKDGAEMGRQHRLPKRIIDLIEQHHGTTLVEYFYNQATQEAESNEVAEANFRYPGPKPQTPEAAVMMLSDAVESASRALREPAPARLEGLVKEIVKKRLHDGQFDECSLTIEQLNIVQATLIKSLNAMYHARVQYPEQQQPA